MSARNLFEDVARQKVDTVQRATASVQMGKMCRLGQGGEMDCNGALILFEEAALYPENSVAHTEAQLKIAEML